MVLPLECQIVRIDLPSQTSGAVTEERRNLFKVSRLF